MTDDSRCTEEGARALGATDSLDYERLYRKPYRSVRMMSHILARQQYPDHPHLRGAYIRAYQLGCRQERIHRIAISDAQLDVDALSQEDFTSTLKALLEKQEEEVRTHASTLYALKNWRDQLEEVYINAYVDAHSIALLERQEQELIDAEVEQELAADRMGL